MLVLTWIIIVLSVAMVVLKTSAIWRLSLRLRYPHSLESGIKQGHSHNWRLIAARARLKLEADPVPADQHTFTGISSCNAMW